MSDFDPKTFPLAAKGNKYEDFSVGQTFDHHWGRTLTSGDNALFSTAMCNWNPMYLNSQYALSHGHPDVVINPMLVLCTVVGLSVEDLSEAGGPFLGVDSCKFHDPVYPGDTVTSKSTVLEMRISESRPSMGIVKWKTEGYKEGDRLILELLRVNLVARKSQQ